MAKRFTDSDKWRDSWFDGLSSKYKLAWLYMLDTCDIAGVWEVNMRHLNFNVGETFEQCELKRVFSDRVIELENGKWFIQKFIDFQYGVLSDKCKPHISVIKLLEKHKIKGYTKGIQTLKDKDKDQDKDQDQDMRKFEIFWNVYDKKVGRDNSLKAWFKLSEKEKEAAIQGAPSYVSAKEKKYRKDPERYLKHKAWMDEVIGDKVVPAASVRQKTPEELMYNEALCNEYTTEQMPSVVAYCKKMGYEPGKMNFDIERDIRLHVRGKE
jgi:hypothetical protein